MPFNTVSQRSFQALLDARPAQKNIAQYKVPSAKYLSLKLLDEAHDDMGTNVKSIMSQTSNFYPLTFVFDGWQSKLQQTLINVIFASPEKSAFVDHRCFYGEAKTKTVAVEWVFNVIEGNKKFSSDQIQFVVADGALRHYVSDIESQSYERRQVQMWGLICQAHSVDLYMENIGTHGKT